MPIILLLILIVVILLGGGGLIFGLIYGLFVVIWALLPWVLAAAAIMVVIKWIDRARG